MTITAFDLSDGNEPMSYGEINFLVSLVKKLPADPIIVNIGAADGVSTVAMLEARRDAFIFSADIGECPQERANLEAAGLDTARVIRLLGRSQDIGKEFPCEADMVLVDGGHDYKSVKGDIEVWPWKVKVGGTLAFHDYIEPPRPANNPSEAYEAVNENLPAEFELTGQVDRLIAFQRMS